MILNLHGLYGKSENSAVKIFRKISAEETRSRYILSPQLEYQTMNPFDCVMKLDRLIRGEEDLYYVVGNSLGGFYAMCISWYYNVPCILTNPCVPPSKYIKGLVENYPSRWVDVFETISNNMRSFEFPVHVILGMDDEVVDPNTTLQYLSERDKLSISGKTMVDIDKIEGGMHRLSKHTKYESAFRSMVYKVEDSICSR